MSEETTLTAVKRKNPADDGLVDGGPVPKVQRQQESSKPKGTLDYIEYIQCT